MVDSGQWPGTSGITIELCAGIVDKDEPLAKIAQAEVLEECGYDVGLEDLKRITSFRYDMNTS